MQYTKVLVCASVAVLALSLACSDGPESPVSPTGSQPGTSTAAADGSTLKATVPAPQSPINNQQPDQLVFVANKSTATYGNPSTPFSVRVRDPQQRRHGDGLPGGDRRRWQRHDGVIRAHDV